MKRDEFSSSGLSRILLSALLKLQQNERIPASQFTAAQKTALDRFARQTGAVICQRQGRGEVYCIHHAELFLSHLHALSPQSEQSGAPQPDGEDNGQGAPTHEALPTRAQNIAHARHSKARKHAHPSHYLHLKAVGEAVHWHETARNIHLPLSQHSHDFGAASLRIERDDHWHSPQPLWLVENQALFDQTDWLPPEPSVTLLYYAGQINNHLLHWLAQRPRASRIIHFPDYDGTGLANFARLHAALGSDCEFWLMPHWQDKLHRYGNREIWLNGLAEFKQASPRLPAYLQPLLQQMRHNALALEQEAVWLPAFSVDSGADGGNEK